MADAWRTCPGDAARATRSQPFSLSLRENLAANYTSIDPKQFFKYRAHLQGPNLEAKMNAKEIDQQACNINAGGRAMPRRDFILHDAAALPHSRSRADKSRGEARGGPEPTRRTRRKGRTYMADKIWRRGASSWRTQDGHMEDRRGGPKGHMAGKWRLADTRPKSFGDAAGLFFLRENPTVNDLGNKRRTQGGQVADKWRARTGGAAKSQQRKVGKWQTQGGHMADKLRRRGQRQHHKADKDWRRGQTQQHKADKWRTHGGQVADKDWRCGHSQQHKAEKWRTRTGGPAKAKKTDKWRTQGGQVADKDWRRGQSQQHKADKCGHKADKDWRRGQSQQHKADKWRTRTGGAAKANSARRTSGGQGLEARPKPTTQGQGLEVRPQPRTKGGQVADTSRTHGGRAPEMRPEHIAASLFFLRENPTVNCLGNQYRLQTVFTRKVRLERLNMGSQNEGQGN